MSRPLRRDRPVDGGPPSTGDESALPTADPVVVIWPTWDRDERRAAHAAPRACADRPWAAGARTWRRRYWQAQGWSSSKATSDAPAENSTSSPETVRPRSSWRSRPAGPRPADLRWRP